MQATIATRTKQQEISLLLARLPKRSAALGKPTVIDQFVTGINNEYFLAQEVPAEFLSNRRIRKAILSKLKLEITELFKESLLPLNHTARRLNERGFQVCKNDIIQRAKDSEQHPIDIAACLFEHLITVPPDSTYQDHCSKVLWEIADSLHATGYLRTLVFKNSLKRKIALLASLLTFKKDKH